MCHESVLAGLACAVNETLVFSEDHERTYVLAFSGDGWPSNYVENGVLVGQSPEFAMKLCEVAGKKCEVALIPRDHLWQTTVNGYPGMSQALNERWYDLYVNVPETAERRMNYLIPEMCFFSVPDPVLVVKKNSKVTLASLLECNNFTLAYGGNLGLRPDCAITSRVYFNPDLFIEVPTMGDIPPVMTTLMDMLNSEQVDVALMVKNFVPLDADVDILVPVPCENQLSTCLTVMARKDDESVIKMWEDALLKFTCEDPQKFDEFCDYLEEKYGRVAGCRKGGEFVDCSAFGGPKPEPATPGLEPQRRDPCDPNFDPDEFPLPKCPPAVVPGNCTIDNADSTMAAVVFFNCSYGYDRKGNESIMCGLDAKWNSKEPTCERHNCGSLDNPDNGVADLSDDTLFEDLAHYECDTGYYLSFGEPLYCDANGWVPADPPVCIIYDCEFPAALENGSISAPVTTWNAVATYECNQGYDLDGTATRTCQHGGQWSGEAATCERHNCGSLDNPDNGVADLSDGTLFEDLAHYECNTGYYLSFVEPLYCDANGWVPADPPVCIIYDCEFPAALADGTISAPVSTWNAVATYECNQGYDLDGIATRTCQHGGQWSGEAATCERHNCGNLDNPDNGVVDLSDGTLFEDLAHYECSTGYYLSFVEPLYCDANGWVPADPPVCIIYDCEFPTALADGTISAPVTTWNAVATYVCNQGYDLDGTATRTCQHGGQWSGEAATCERHNCGNLDNPDNGVVDLSDGTLFEDLAHYECNTGYYLSFVEPLYCDANGWVPADPPVCIIYDCEFPAALADGTISAPVTTWNAVATYECNQGYDLDGTATRTCQHGGQWSGEAATCERHNCSNLDNPDNGLVDLSDGTLFEDLANYECNTGYYLSFGEPLYCDANGWVPADPPVCIIYDCEFPAALADGTISAPVTTWNAVATYECNQGYDLDGTATRTCQHGGQWSGEAATCERHNCGNLDNPDNGVVDLSDGTIFEDLAHYECNTGYYLSFVEPLYCDANGWVPADPPVCIIYDCEFPAALADGTISAPVTTWNAVATYECNQGYDLDGTATRTCQHGGQWSGEAATCERHNCGNLDNPDNGVVNIPVGTLFQDLAYYECDTGHYRSFSEPLYCDASGWVPADPPVCIIYDCAFPTALADGSISAPVTTWNAVATYTCNEGYDLDGSATRTCQDGGDWSEVAPTCIASEYETYIIGNGAPYKGVVQIVLNSVVYSICDHGWDHNDCKVICRAAGYGGGKTFKTGYFSGLVVGPPMLDNVDCEGTEANLIYCAGVAWAPRSCSNNSLAGCKCD